jgi:hypothetical protein
MADFDPKPARLHEQLNDVSMTGSRSRASNGAGA